MRALWAIAAGIALGGGLAWYLSREAPESTAAKKQRAEQAASEQARDARPSIYRWRDDAGVLQITDKPPKNQKYERIDRDAPAAITVNGDGESDDTRR
ncbi:DUF4124 domain-containing protein [Pseudoxanthomonas sp. UTMC 1351]|uniref:DUF4124 domain-containing protein n=1 Tax=Pseudoxanthomonas sp. UTMC 1351 TaxID=2695853 RepID=UPI0034CE1E3D